MKENKKLRGDIFSMYSDLLLHSSARKETDNNYVCRYIDGPSRRGGVRIIERSATRAVANARASSAGDAKYFQGLMAIRLPSRKYGGLYSDSRERGGASDYGIYRPTGKVRERPRQW